jgi:hypothetical protein
LAAEVDHLNGLHGRHKREAKILQYLRPVRRFLLPFACVVCGFAFGQTRPVRDSVLTATHFHVVGGMGAPARDLAERYGAGGQFGIGAGVKWRSGWFTGIEAMWGFGAPVREAGVLANLLTPDGQLIDNEGQVALLQVTGRSGLFSVHAGRLFRLPNGPANSGILATFGAGSLHHRVHFENTENEITQLQDPYLAGYDRLAWGPALRQTLAWWNMSDDGLRNWFVGLEAWQARTLPQRAMNFDTGVSEIGARFDASIAVRAGWVIHVYKRPNRDFWN